MKKSDPRLQSLIAMTRGAMDALSEGNHEAAQGLLDKLDASAAALGITSAFLSQAKAMAARGAGATELAFEHIQTAVQFDCLDPSLQGHYEGITWMLRSVLADASLPPNAQQVERIYKALSRAGEADVPCHLTFARAHLFHDRLAEAAALVSAVNVLSPASVDAWRLRAVIARMQGDEAKASECEREAQLRADAAIPFAMPGPTMEC
jgi:hypothetical protein